ncbi:pF334L [African swine fever virus]|uniref:PF334L n=1 Tax=African swine fever virus TaxID=10497 RepID=A0A8A1V2B3_ASF|nr:pF334L [African swine fever virus]
MQIIVVYKEFAGERIILITVLLLRTSYLEKVTFFYFITKEFTHLRKRVSHLIYAFALHHAAQIICTVPYILQYHFFCKTGNSSSCLVKGIPIVLIHQLHSLLQNFVYVLFLRNVIHVFCDTKTCKATVHALIACNILIIPYKSRHIVLFLTKLDRHKVVLQYNALHGGEAHKSLAQTVLGGVHPLPHPLRHFFIVTMFFNAAADALLFLLIRDQRFYLYCVRFAMYALLGSLHCIQVYHFLYFIFAHTIGYKVFDINFVGNNKEGYNLFIQFALWLWHGLPIINVLTHVHLLRRPRQTFYFFVPVPTFWVLYTKNTATLGIFNYYFLHICNIYYYLQIYWLPWRRFVLRRW